MAAIEEMSPSGDCCWAREKCSSLGKTRWLDVRILAMATSSNFRHVPKVFLHFLRAAVMAVASVEALQTLAASTISLRLELVQQEQASAEFVFLPGESIDN